MLVLRCRRPPSKIKGSCVRAKGGAQTKMSKETRTSVLQLCGTADNLNEPGSGFFPRALNKECSPANTLVSAL